MPDKEISYNNKETTSLNIETRTLVLKKTIRCKFGYSIPKGTQVSVFIETIRGDKYYRVAYPHSNVLMLSAKPTDFVSLEEDKTPIKTTVKVGDEYWFVTMHNFRIWKDTVVNVTDRYAYFEKGNYGDETEIEKDGKFRIYLRDFRLDTEVRIDMSGKYKNVDEVWFSKKKPMVQGYALQSMQDLKEQQLTKLQEIADEHAKHLSEFEVLENKEKELLKLLGKVVS